MALDCLVGNPSDTLLGVATGVSGRMHFWVLEADTKDGGTLQGAG